MGTKSVTFSVSFTDGVNQNIQVDSNLRVEMFDGPDPTVKKILTLTSTPAIVENPLPNDEWDYHVSNLDISDFLHDTITVKWYADFNGSPVAEYPVVDQPQISTAAGNPVTVVSTTPLATAFDVDPQAPIQIEFNQPLDPDTVTIATIIIYEAATNKRQPATVNVSSSNACVAVLTPTKELKPDRGYFVSAVGLANGGSTYIKSTSGNSLATSHTFVFKTGQDKYEKLEEVTSPGDIERAAPVRVPFTAQPAPAATTLTILTASPDSFSSNVEVDGLSIVLTFSEDIDPNTVSDITVTQAPVLGLDEFLGCVDGGTSRLAIQGTECVYPTFTPTVSGAVVTLAPDTSVLHNAEITVTVPTTVKNVGGTKSIQNQVQWVFTTEYFPLWVSPEMLRLELDTLISDYTDDTLRRYSLKAALDIIEFSSDGRINLTDPGHTVRNIVKWSSLVDLAELVLTDAGVAGTKQLGQFVITVDTEAQLNGRLKSFRDRLDKAWKTYHRKKLGPVVCIRGSNSLTELPNFRIRTWRNYGFQKIGDNNPADRMQKVPTVLDAWS